MDIDLLAYKLEGVQELFPKLADKTPKRVWTYRLAFLENLNNYWLYAVAATRLHQESIVAGLGLIDKDYSYGKERDDCDQKSHSSAVSSYNHMRICLLASKKLCENAIQSAHSDETIEALQKYRNKKDHRVLANSIITIRNLVGAHPDNADEIITGATIWGSDGEIHFREVDLDNFRISNKWTSLDPAGDLLKLRDYIQGLLPLLGRCWNIDDSNPQRLV